MDTQELKLLARQVKALESIAESLEQLTTPTITQEELNKLLTEPSIVPLSNSEDFKQNEFNYTVSAEWDDYVFEEDIPPSVEETLVKANAKPKYRIGDSFTAYCSDGKGGKRRSLSTIRGVAGSDFVVHTRYTNRTELLSESEIDERRIDKDFIY